MPTSRKRAKVRDARGARPGEPRKLTPRQYTRRRFFGWSLVVLGVAVGVGHWFQHLAGIDVLPRIIGELGLGYPMAGALAIAGVIVLSR